MVGRDGGSTVSLLVDVTRRGGEGGRGWLEGEVPHLVLQQLQAVPAVPLSVEVLHQLGVGVVRLQDGRHPPRCRVRAGRGVREEAGGDASLEVLGGRDELNVGQPRVGVDLVQVLHRLHGQARVEEGGDVGPAVGGSHPGEQTHGFDWGWFCKIVERLREPRYFRPEGRGGGSARILVQISRGSSDT